MRIAIFHDYIGNIGGAEKLILILAKELDADVITTDINEDTIKKMGYTDVNIISIGETIKFPPLKQISASLKFAICDFSKDYDFFIFSGDWGHFAAKKHRPNMLYCHTPNRAFYDLYYEFLQQLSTIEEMLFRIWVTLHKPISQHYLKYVDQILTNSKNTQKRIKKYFNRYSTVVYPPVDTSKYKFKEYSDFWLSVNRLYPAKRVDLQIEAFRQLHEERLIIIGGYAEGDHSAIYAKKISKNLPKNVELYNNVSEDKLIDLYARCKGHITTAINEDFGMTVIEAMACGKPVIAVREGGYLETVIDGVTGILIKPHKEDIIRAIKTISEKPEQYKNPCEQHAKKFDVSIFIKQINNEITSKSDI